MILNTFPTHGLRTLRIHISQIDDKETRRVLFLENQKAAPLGTAKTVNKTNE